MTNKKPLQHLVTLRDLDATYCGNVAVFDCSMSKPSPFQTEGGDIASWDYVYDKIEPGYTLCRECDRAYFKEVYG